MESKHEGIGGWLILIVFGLLLIPVFRLYALYQTYWTVYNTPGWSLLTESGNPLYHSWFEPTFWMGVGVDLLFIVLSIAGLWLLVTRSSHFPRFMISFLIAMTVFAVADGLMTNWIFGTLPITADTLEYIQNQSYRHQAGALLLSMIWIPYLMRSKRVKATFVQKSDHNTVAGNPLTF